MKTALVVNPASGNGRTGRRWAHIERTIRAGLRSSFQQVHTQRPGHATHIVRDLLQDGVEMIVSVGGDGTHNEVLNGFFREGRLINPDACLAPITLGTGGDFVRSLGWEKSLSFALDRIEAAEVRWLDVGLAEYRTPDGSLVGRYFLNVVDFGAGGAVVERVNRTTKMFGGRVSFLWGIVTTLISYRNKPVTYALDAGGEQHGIFNNVIVGNGQYYGGGIRAVPMAQPDDGFLDVVFIGDVSLAEAMISLPRFRKGTHLTIPKVSWARCTQIEARCEDTVFVDLDGECVGTLPARFQVLPRAIRCVA